MSPMYDDVSGFLELQLHPNDVEGDLYVQYYVYRDGYYEEGQVLSFIIHTPGTVGIKDISKLDFSIYPNPVQNNLIISSESVIKQICVFDLIGHTVFHSITASPLDLNINTSLWIPGIYFAKVEDMYGKVNTRKFIKK